MVEMLQRLFTDVRNIPGDFFRSEFGITSSDFEFLNMNRSKDVFLEHLLGNENSILKVITIPRHEADEDITTECHFTLLSGGTIGDDLARLDFLTPVDDGLLIETGARV